jgi:large subunit ribosomal protein L6
MSRIGKKAVSIPAGVEVKIGDDNTITVKGPKGELSEQISDKINIEKVEGALSVQRRDDEKVTRAAHGLYRSLVSNMITGVTAGFEKKLQLVGIGYRAEKKGNMLVMHLGFSHPVEMEDPSGITTEVTTPTEIIVKGISKSLVGNYAANIRDVRIPEPYKGKGIKYSDEIVRRKEGKAGSKKK